MARETRSTGKHLAMPELQAMLNSWELAFRADALADGFAHVQPLVCELPERSLKARAKRAVDATVNLVRITAHLLATQQRKAADIRRFVKNQRYDLSSARVRYLVTFADYDQSPSWLLVDDLQEIDLEDIIGAHPLRKRLIEHIAIGRTDGKALSRTECRRLKKRVIGDLFFDREWNEGAVEFEEGPELCVYLENLDKSEGDAGLGDPDPRPPSARITRSPRA